MTHNVEHNKNKYESQTVKSTLCVCFQLQHIRIQAREHQCTDYLCSLHCSLLYFTPTTVSFEEALGPFVN